MNSLVTTTGLLLNQILYGHVTRDRANMIDLQDAKHIARHNQKVLFWQKAADVIAFADAKAKLQYNKSHTDIKFKVGDKVYLRLHKGYTLPNAPNKKLLNQQVGPFEITQQIRQLAYRLNLPPLIKIYPVVSVTQLKPLKSKDPYQKERLDHPSPVEIEEKKDRPDGQNQQSAKTYKIKRIVGKQSRRYRREKPRT